MVPAALAPGTVAEYDWEEAIDQADELSFAGYDDWRLPNL